MTNKIVTPLGRFALVQVLKVEDTTKGGIILTSGDKEESVHGVVLAKPEFSYHPDGSLKVCPFDKGDTVCFMKNAGSTVMEAPEGETWLVIPDDCIYYKVETHE